MLFNWIFKFLKFDINPWEFSFVEISTSTSPKSAIISFDIYFLAKSFKTYKLKSSSFIFNFKSFDFEFEKGYFDSIFDEIFDVWVFDCIVVSINPS